MTNLGGTQQYMAPEQLKSKTNQKSKSYFILTDVYGFGSLVADLFFKSKIFQGQGLEEFSKINSKNQLCAGVKEILEKCLIQEP